MRASGPRFKHEVERGLSGAAAKNYKATSAHDGAVGQTLSNALGSAGTFSFGVGGSFPVANTTPSGIYSGSFNVTVTYN